MRKGDKGKTVFGVILILTIVVSVFGGAVSAGDVSGGLKQSVDDAEIQTAVWNFSSEELTEALDDDPLHQVGSVYASSSNLGDQAASLAEAVVRAPYLWGGKGWCYVEMKFVDSANIKSGYYYWNPTAGQVDWGQGLDCSGLSFWSYNKAAGATKHTDSSNPIYYEGASGQWTDDARLEHISKGDLKRGDLLFLIKGEDVPHVIMYVGNGYVVHAEGVIFNEIKKEELSTVETRYTNYGYTIGYGRVKAASGDKFNIGDIVRVTTNLNVRTGPGTSYPKITDPDYPGYAPAGTIGIVLSGPSSADSFIWWEVNYGPGLYSGWSVEDWLEKVDDNILPTVDAFSVTPASVTLGDTFTIPYTVLDTGGSGLKQVELWRKGTGVWERIGDPISLVGEGDGPYSNSFYDAPTSIGTYEYGIHVVDNAGNLGLEPDPPGPIEVEVTPSDTTPPPPPILSSSTHPNENNWYNNNDPAFTWTTPSDTSGIAGYSYTIDHSSSTTPDTSVDTTGNSKSYINLADGTWYFHVRAKDNAGNWGNADHYRVKVDTVNPPVPTISSSTHPNENNWYNNNDPSFTWTTPSDTSGIAGYSYTIEHSSSTTPDTSVDTTGNSKSYTNLADGTWYFHVRAKDNAGNWGNADHYRVKVDTVNPPVPTISSSTHPNENNWYNNNDPSFTWTTPSDTSGIAGYSYTIDHSSSTTPDTSVDTTGNSKSYTNLADGTWYFHVRAKDNAGNWGSADHYRVKIDTNQPPTAIIDSITPDPAEQGTDIVSFSGHGTDTDGTVVAYNWRSSIDGQLSTSAAFTKPASELSVGTHTIYFKVQDDDGAWSTEDTEDLTINPANQQPTAIIDSITPDPAEQGTDTVSFSGHGTDTDGTVVAYNWRSSIDGQLSTSAAFTKPASELSVGTHTIYFKVQDDDGAWSTEDTEDLTINPANQQPTAIIDSITPDPAEQGTDTVSFSGHGTDTDGTVVAYNWRSSIDGQLSTSAAFTKPASELSVGTHTIYFKVQDNDGAWSTEDTEDLTINPGPELSYSPTSHNFGNKCEGVRNSTTFEIWNSGTGTLTYTLSESCGWVEVNPASGTSTEEHDTITVDIDTTGLSEGLHTCDISISSNGGSGTFTVTVTVISCECDGTDTSCGIYPDCENCNEDDGCYVYDDGCEERDYYCTNNEEGCDYTYSNRHTDGWVDTGNTRWEDVNECQEKEQKEQEYRDYSCSGGACTCSVTDTQWLDTGTTQNKPDETICGCTARNTLKRCYSGVCTDTGICDSTTCGADAACDGKEPGDSCGAGVCDSNCKCGGPGEDTAVFRNGVWCVDTSGNHIADLVFGYGIPGDVPLVGGFNKDGSDDIAIFRNGIWCVDTTGNHIADLVFCYGIAGDVPLVGDFNKDGSDDIAIFRNGIWCVDTTGNHIADLVFCYGIAGDVPLVGDFNKDGSDDIAIFRNGIWCVDTTGNRIADLVFCYGIAGDVPLVGDFNKDGSDDIAIFRNGIWCVDTTGNRIADLVFCYGIAGDAPLVGDIG